MAPIAPDALSNSQILMAPATDKTRNSQTPLLQRGHVRTHTHTQNRRLMDEIKQRDV